MLPEMFKYFTNKTAEQNGMFDKLPSMDCFQ